MRCVVFEPDVTGHRLQHVHHLSAALLEIGCDVSLVLQSDCREHAEYRVHLRELEPHVEVRASLDPGSSPTFATRWRRVAQLLDTLADHRPDWAYVPYADGFTQTGALRRLLVGGGRFHRVPIEGQIMRGRYGYPRVSVLEGLNAAANRWLTRRSPWHVTHVLDPFAMKGLEPLPNVPVFRLIPEPVEHLPAVDRQSARATLGVPTDGRYLAFVGGVHPRKGIDLLIAAFKRANLPNDHRLLFVGKVAPQIQELLYRDEEEMVRQGRIVVVDRYVSDEELNCGFLAADIVAVTYPRQIGSSGTLVRAAAAERPVLASEFGWVGWATNTFHLGTTVDVSNLDRYTAAMVSEFANCGKYRHSEAARRFCKYHTVANQKAHWVASIGQERGLPLGPMAQRIDWSWVMEATDDRN